jgi:hypothetical protein
METKTIHWLLCDGCGGSFSENLMGHYENDVTHWEADLCDNCASKQQAKYEI